MQKVNENIGITRQSDIQYLINDWLAREDVQCELQAVMNQEKMKTMKQSKHLKEMSNKLNKIQRQIMRENNVISKEKTSEIADLNKLLSRAHQWFMNSRKNKAYLNQIQLQVSSIYNAGAELLEKKSKNEILLQQLKQTQIKLQTQLSQSKNKLKTFENMFEVSKIEHKIKEQRFLKEFQL